MYSGRLKKLGRILIATFDNIMTDPVNEKVQRLFDSRATAEADLNTFQKDVSRSKLLTYCEDAMTKAFSKNEQLLELAKKTSDPGSVTEDLGKWFNDTTVQSVEILSSAKEYIDDWEGVYILCHNTDRS